MWLFNVKCYRPWSAESRTENVTSTGNSVADILNVKVQEINNFLSIFFIFLNSVAKIAAYYVCIK